MELVPISQCEGKSLLWQSPSIGWRQLFSGEQKPHLLLVEGTESPIPIAELYRRGPFRVVESAGTWQLEPRRLFSTTQQLFDPDQRSVGELYLGLGGTRLSFHSGKTYMWKKGKHWEDDYHSTILTFSRHWKEPGRAHLTIGSECDTLPELLLLAGLGWHLILESDEASAAASAAAVSG